MHERLREIRLEKKMNQAEFANLLGMGQSTLGMMEVGKREILDRHIKTICSICNVNEHWLRTGEGEMFIHSNTFSLDDYAKKNSLTPLELDIIRGYMELDKSTRQNLMNYFKTVFNKHNEVAATAEDEIDREVENYRLELEATRKGKTSSAFGQREGNIG